ncbi:subunit beta of proteasome [Hamiltosporidium tvaerminnensis]|uniref:Proteasome subunit beta n=2 Tax=Hamiltosporidium TaxID=1176354 RepID=A0A4Q9L8F3_9MICR|nr:subunit beta of proteasome [Hamiltosporidium magnivora]TBU10152.1 subunit beta of proteasome [Hamiltosporidium tvaerminnensis]
MDSLIGIKGNDFVLIASDTVTKSSLLLIKDDENKFYKINSHLIMAYSGEQGDSFRNCSFTAEKVKFECLQNQIHATPSVVANVLQKKLHTALRKQPLSTSCLIAGKTPESFSLYQVDTYGAISSSKYFSLGASSYFTYGILDKNYHEGITLEQALSTLQECVNVLKKRFVLDIPTFIVNIVRDSGIESLSLKPSE